MATSRRKLTHDRYRIALIYVKPLEMNAIIPMLDEEHEELKLHEQDQNEYTLGKIGHYNVIVVGPPIGAQGKVAIADVIGQIRFTFGNVKMGLLVGIGGGVPRTGYDVRLGDVVVGAPEYGPAVVEYDLGKQNPDGTGTRQLNKPPSVLLNVVSKIKSRYQRLKAGDEPFFLRHLKRFEDFPNIKDIYCHPRLPDRLFRSDYLHEPGTNCGSHGNQYLVERSYRDPTQELVRIHHGTILSGDLVMKWGKKRDEISERYDNALCFEMEAAGLVDSLPCLIIRGICDYCDSHKNKEWQGYAAATAAAYAREVLCNMTDRDISKSESPCSGSGTRDSDCEKAQRDEFLKMLSFDEMSNREARAEKAYNTTYEWLRKSPKYINWKTSKGGKLLIKGKAGCGKSTMMKHLYTTERALEPDSIVCAFFFNNRGTPFERTTEAMFRTIIYQIVSQDQGLFKHLRCFYAVMKHMMETRVRHIAWTKDQLEEMFMILARSPDLNAWVYIDALDEGEGFIPSSMFGFLEELLDTPSNGIQSGLRICLSSRPDNFVNYRAKWTTIDLGNGNRKDIECYVSSELHATAAACSHRFINYQRIVEELCTEILQKANGVFLWAKLVIKRLQEAMNGLQPECVIFEILAKSPPDLYDLFASCLERVNKRNYKEMEQILQIVMVAERPLSVEELLDFIKVISSDTNDNRTSLGKRKRGPKRMTIDEECYRMQVQIQNWCGGLVEAVEAAPYQFSALSPDHLYLGAGGSNHRLRPSRPRIEVQFMHQSVKDFLRTRIRINAIVSDEIETTAHRLMFNSCLRYVRHLTGLKLLNFGIEASGGLLRPGTPCWDNNIRLRHPFLQYSPFWIIHAEKVTGSGVGKLSEGEIRCMDGLFLLYGCDESENSDRYRKLYSDAFGYIPDIYLSHVHSSLLIFLACQNFPDLFNALLQYHGLKFKQKALDRALLAACHCGFRNRGTIFKVDDESPMILTERAWLAKETMVDLLIRKGADVNARLSFGPFWNPLTVACQSGRLKLVKSLIDAGADVNVVSYGKFPTPLMTAARNGDISIARLLIHRGALINVQAGETGTALAEAVYRGDNKMVGFLLCQGAMVDMPLDVIKSRRYFPQGGGFGTHLILAAREGHEETVKLLVSYGANVNLHCRQGSPLSAASSSYSRRGISIMNFLIDKGAIVDMLLENCRTGSALISTLASAHSQHQINILARVMVLVERGADVNLRVTSGEYGSALIAAVDGLRSCDLTRNEDFSTIKYLIGRGARVNEQPTVGLYGSALIAAAVRASLGAMRLLILMGADPNLSSLTGSYSSPLAVVIGKHDFESRWYFDIKRRAAIQLLLDNHAVVDSVIREGSHRRRFFDILLPYIQDKTLIQKLEFSEDEESDATEMLNGWGSDSDSSGWGSDSDSSKGDLDDARRSKRKRCEVVAAELYSALYSAIIPDPMAP